MERVRVVEMEGKGRGVVAAQPLRGGEVVLSDLPILLYSALLPTSCSSYCARCFTSASSNGWCRCPSCSVEAFCSPGCLSAAAASLHSAWACKSLAHLRQHHDALDYDHLLQARFLIAAYSLSPSDFQALLSLQGSPDPSTTAAAHFLHSLGVFASCDRSFSVELSAALLAKDKLNAFGLMEPFNGEEQTRCSVRAYGIYPKASLFNHDCLPNACRFDYVDSGSLYISVRMIHDVPEGREICLSYFPVNENYASRQRRLREDYGFCCDCDRCKVEANWSDQEEEEEEEEEEEAMEEDAAIAEDKEEEEAMKMASESESLEPSESSFPHAYFFARYMCDRNNCWGTLAPLPPEHQPPNDGVIIMECNVCANLTSAQH